MRYYSKEELATLRDFYNNLSVAWIAGGTIGPIFSSTIDISQRFFYTILGFIGGYVLLKLSLEISKQLK